MEQLTHTIAKYGPDPGFLLFIIFLFSLGKSVIVISSVLPPASVTLIMGILAGKHTVPAGYLWAAITLGAALGSILSFHCGTLLCRDQPLTWLPTRFHAPLRKAQHTLQQRGMSLLFASRFLAVMRYTVPLMAGLLTLPPKQVYLTVTLSAAIWAVALMAVAHLFPSF